MVENYLYGKLNRVELYNSGVLTHNVALTYHERDRVIEVSDLATGEVHPTLVRLSATYPRAAREEGREGTVQVAVSFDEVCVMQGYRIVFAAAPDFADAVREQYDLLLARSEE